MEYRFLLLLLFAFMACESAQARRFFSSKSRTTKPKSTVHRKTYTPHTVHHNTGYESHVKSQSDSLLQAERGGQRRPTTPNLEIFHPKPPPSTHRETHFPKNTPAPPAVRTQSTYPPWGNPYFVTTQRPRPPLIYNNNGNVHQNNYRPSHNQSNTLNTHGISVPVTPRSPYGSQNNGGSSHHYNRPNITNTPAIPNPRITPAVNSTLFRNPNARVPDNIRPIHNQQIQGAPIPSAPHQTPYIPNTPPYPLHPVHPTPIHPDHISRQNTPPYGSSPIQNSPIHPSIAGQIHTMPHSNTPYPVQSPHPGNVMYPNQYPYPQPHYSGPVSYPSAPILGGVYPGSPVAYPHGGQPQYPQQAPIYHSAPSPAVVVVPNQQDSGRGVGQIFKEALIYSGVNAAVNRIINPSHYHQHSENYGRPVATVPNSETTNTHSTHTEITYNTQYFNTVPGSDGTIPAGSGVAQPGVPTWNSLSGTPGGQVYQPGTMIPNQPVAPGAVGQPMVPGTATVAQPVVPGNINAQPAVSGAPSVGQPAVPGASPVGQPAIPGVPLVGQPAVPGAPPVGQPAVSGAPQVGQSAVPGASPVGQPVPPGVPLVGQPALPEASPVGQPVVPVSNNSSQSIQETAANTFQYRITDQELQLLSEDLFNKDEFNAYKYMTLNMQGHSNGSNISDLAPESLFQVMPVAYTIPTVQALRSLYDDYVLDSRVKEITTMGRRRKENTLLDVFMNTNVMSITMTWLSKQEFVKNDDYEKKEMLDRIWFTEFDGTSSGFERIFVAEFFDETQVLGVQDWVYFDYQESKNRINYLGYVDKQQLGDKAALLKVDFRLDGVLRQNGTLFVGISPELEMALYTICYYARPGDICPISLGGTKVNLYTHPYRYLGKDTIDLALPIF